MNDVVYVVSWRRTEEMSSASMDALLWTLGNNLNDESTFPSYSSLPIQRCKANGNRIRRKREQWSRDQNIERNSSFISSPDILLDCLERYMYVDKLGRGIFGVKSWSSRRLKQGAIVDPDSSLSWHYFGGMSGDRGKAKA